MGGKAAQNLTQQGVSFRDRFSLDRSLHQRLQASTKLDEALWSLNRRLLQSHLMRAQAVCLCSP